MKMAIWIMGGLAALIVATAGAFWFLRPEGVAVAAIERQYGGPPSRFVKLPSGSVARYQDYPADAEARQGTIVLLHGGSISLESWTPWIERLHGDWRIIAVDLPGHGLTGVTVENDYSVPGMVAFVDSFTRTLGLDQPFVLAGHSMGGHVAWRFTLLHPGRVNKLVLVAPGGIVAAGGPQAKAFQLAAAPGGSVVLRLAASRERLESALRTVFHDGSLVTAAMIDRYWTMSQRVGSLDAAVARLQSPSFDPASVARLGDIKKPMLLLWGRDDIVYPSHLARAFMSAMPSTTLVEYNQCGHFPHEEFPDRTAADLRAFLRNEN